MNNFENRKVSVLLGIGIFLIPLIFAWFTLKKGYSTKARVLSFGWLIMGVIAFMLMPEPSKHNTVEAPIAAETSTVGFSPSKE